MALLVPVQGGKMKGKFDPTKLTGTLLKAARALSGLSAETLAEEAKVGLRTIRRAEIAGEETVDLTDAVTESIIAALEKHVQFIPENGGGLGVRMKHPEQSRAKQRERRAAKKRG
jgi:hypothetical protein